MSLFYKQIVRKTVRIWILHDVKHFTESKEKSTLLYQQLQNGMNGI